MKDTYNTNETFRNEGNFKDLFQDPVYDMYHDCHTPNNPGSDNRKTEMPYTPIVEPLSPSIQDQWLLSFRFNYDK